MDPTNRSHPIDETVCVCVCVYVTQQAVHALQLITVCCSICVT